MGLRGGRNGVMGGGNGVRAGGAGGARGKVGRVGGGRWGRERGLRVSAGVGGSLPRKSLPPRRKWR